jgi:protein TonB
MNSAALDKLPEFPGGIAKFYTYVGRNFESPEYLVIKTLEYTCPLLLKRWKYD